MAEITENPAVRALEDGAISPAFHPDQLGFNEYCRTGGWSLLHRGSQTLRIGHCPGIVPMKRCPHRCSTFQAAGCGARLSIERLDDRQEHIA